MQFLQKVNRNSNHTIGVEFGSKIVQLGDENIKLQIWDTAGQERFRSVSRTYYRGSLGAIIVFDVTNQDSFNNLNQWVLDARQLARPDIQIVILGNKCDLSEQRVIDSMDANKYCKDMGLPYLETSALSGQNIQEAFQLIIKNIMYKIQDGKVLILGTFENGDYRPPNYDAKLNTKKDQKDAQGCCQSQKSK